MDKKENKNGDYLYKVERVCGNGSFGIVFQAKVIHTGEIVAIKKVYLLTVQMLIKDIAQKAVAGLQ